MNLVFNSDFERGDVVGWKMTPLATGTINTFTAVTADKHGGNYSGWLSLSGAFGANFHAQVETDDAYRIPVVPGTVYETGMWVKGLGSSNAGYPNVNIQWYDSNGAFISKVQLGNAATPGTGWQLDGNNLVVGRATAPSNAAFATLMFDILSASTTSFYLDDAYFILQPSTSGIVTTTGIQSVTL